MAICIIDLMERHRKQQRFSQFEMASFLNVSQPTYNNWINRKNRVDLKHYPAISRLCQVPLREIMPAEFE